MRRVSRREFIQYTSRYMKELPLVITNRGQDELVLDRYVEVNDYVEDERKKDYGKYRSDCYECGSDEGVNTRKFYKGRWYYCCDGCIAEKEGEQV